MLTLDDVRRALDKLLLFGVRHAEDEKRAAMVAPDATANGTVDVGLPLK